MTNCQWNLQIRHIHHDDANFRNQNLPTMNSCYLTSKIQRTTLICVSTRHPFYIWITNLNCLEYSPKIYGVIPLKPNHPMFKRQLIALIFSPVLQRFAATWAWDRFLKNWVETDEDRSTSFHRHWGVSILSWLVVLNIFYVHPDLGKWSNLTHIFQRGWNHQPVSFS